MTIDSKTAIERAKAFINDIFSNVKDLRLEEIERSSDQKNWLVTFSFPRPDFTVLRTNHQSVPGLQNSDSGFKFRRGHSCQDKRFEPMKGSIRPGSEFTPRATLLDTNLLLLLFIGTFDRQRIGKFKRTQHFSQADFELLVAFLKPARKIITTPHILTEVSNLAGQMDSNLLPGFYSLFARLVRQLQEVNRYAADIVTTDIFTRLSLTDAVTAAIGSASIRVLTDDLPLAAALRNRGVTVIQFDHLRNVAQA